MFGMSDIKTICQLLLIKTIQYKIINELNLDLWDSIEDYMLNNNVSMIIKCQDILPRDDKYISKNLPQEIGIIQNLEKIIPKNNINDSLVIDLGGGNGDLGYLISKILNINVYVVDLRCPDYHVELHPNFTNKSNKFMRITDNVKNLDLCKINYKHIYFVCKHLCGMNLDSVLNEVILNDKEKQGTKIKGFVLVPCCYHRGIFNEKYLNYGISYSDYKILSKSVDFKVGSTNKNYNYEKYKIGKCSEQIINSIRINKIYNFFGCDKINIEYLEFVESNITPKNVMIVGKMKY